MKTCGQCKSMGANPRYPNIGVCNAPCPAAWQSYSGGHTHVDDPQAEDCVLFTPVSAEETSEEQDCYVALETLINGLVWHIENHPEIMNECDNEALAMAQKALARKGH